MSSSTDIESTVIEAIKMTMHSIPASISTASRLREDLGVDSMQFVALQLELEDAFGLSVELDEARIAKLITVGDVVALVDHLRTQAG